MVIKRIKADWKKGTSKKTGKDYIALEITLQGTEKFTVTQMVFLNDMQCQLLGIEKPKA